MTKIKIILWFTSTIIISILIYTLLYKDIHPLGGLNLRYDAEGIENQSAAFLEELGITTSGLNSDTDLKNNRQLTRQIQAEKGLSEGNQLIAEGLPAYYWDVEWFTQDFSSLNITGAGPRSSRTNEKGLPYEISYTTNGELISFRRNDIDTLPLKKLTSAEAIILADEFLQKFSPVEGLKPDTIAAEDTSSFSGEGFILTNSERRESDKRTDYNYSWKGRSPELNNEMNVFLTISGDLVSEFRIEEIIPEGKYTNDLQSIYQPLSTVLFYIVIFILLGVIAFKRIRAFEIGFRTAIVAGLIVAIGFGIEIYLTFTQAFAWQLLIPLLLGPLLYGTAVMLLWAVSETVLREAWDGKFISIDLFTRGYLLHSKIGSAFLMGSSSGLLISAVWLLLFFIVSVFLPVSFTVNENDFLPNINSEGPGLTLLIHNIYSIIFVTVIFFMFVASGLKRRMNSHTLLFIVISLLWGIINMRNINPVYAAIIIEAAVGGLFLFLFWKYDLLTVLIGLITFNVALNGYAFFISGHNSYINSGYFLGAVFILLTIYALINLFTRDRISDFKNITPAFVKNITERQRLQRELEIAKDVQMSLLPGKNPSFNNLQIASRCLPALEVGGDYYDFVKLSDKLSGIIIGDVSGKGTQAAFYMTLTKGFLKALSKTSRSASELLISMNELFYENVERGTFISMIYAIFDTEKKLLRLARAGHNPVIAKKSVAGKVTMINPTGIALGLEKGTIFNKTIKEMEVQFEAGDVFVFYTDGFTEAMNKTEDEYGELRLSEAVEKHSDKTAEELLEIIFTDVKTFMGKAKQHDDMTMVVVKVTS